jgi:hypothetical protein
METKIEKSELLESNPEEYFNAMMQNLFGEIK